MVFRFGSVLLAQSARAVNYEKNASKKIRLQKWFDKTFDKNEKKILLDSCPLFSMYDGEFNSDSPAYFLADTLQWYNKKDNVVICMKAVKEVLHLLNEEKSFAVQDLHFIYLNLINTLYRHRDFEGACVMSALWIYIIN